MKVTDERLDALVPYAANAKKHDKRQINNVAESIRQYGFVQPIVIDRDGVIVIGHCRALAAKKLGMKEVPCVCVDELTPEQVNALRLVDNKSAEDGASWDFDLLAGELPSLDLSAFDFDLDIENEEDYGVDFSLPDGDKSEICQMTFTLHAQQKQLIEYAISCVADEITETFGNANKNGNALYEVVRQWAAQRT